MNRKHVFVSGVVITFALSVTAQGCSSESDDGSSSPGGSSAGTAGTAGSGGTASGTGGTSSGTGGTTAVGPCGTGIRNGVTTCTASCTGSICGLADLGSRDCNCVSGIYQCASCEFTGSEPILDAPDAALPDCPGAEDTIKGTACTQAEQGERCELTADRTRVCACWNAEWDCDSKPWD